MIERLGRLWGWDEGMFVRRGNMYRAFWGWNQVEFLGWEVIYKVVGWIGLSLQLWSWWRFQDYHAYSPVKWT